MAIPVRQLDNPEQTVTITSPPTLIFSPISPSQSFTSCGPGSINWTYTGPQGLLTLNITNDVPQLQQPHPLPRRAPKQSSPPPPANISQTITSNGNPQASSYAWPKLYVPQGEYVIQAFMYDNNSNLILNAQSSSLEVVNGSDTSCINIFPPYTYPSSQSPSTPPPSPPSSSTSIDLATSSPEVRPSSSTNEGAVAGGVTGGILLIIICLLCLFLLYRKKRRPPLIRAWGGLSSSDSHALGVGNSKPTPTPNTPYINRIPHLPPPPRLNVLPPSPPAPKKGRMRMSDPFSNAHAAPPDSLFGVPRSHSDVDVSRFAPSVEAIAAAGGRVEGADGISPLPYAYLSHRSSLNSNHYPVRHREREGSSGSFSVESAAHANNHTSRRSVDYRAAPLSRSHSASERGAEMIPMGRSSSTGSTLAKKTPRKPVPQYNPAEFRSSQDDDLGPRDSTQLEADGDGYASARSSSIHGHVSVERTGSIGERPMHYLMPDMPMSSSRG